MNAYYYNLHALQTYIGDAYDESSSDCYGSISSNNSGFDVETSSSWLRKKSAIRRTPYVFLIEEDESVFGSTDLAGLKSAWIVEFYGRSSGLADFEVTVDR